MKMFGLFMVLTLAVIAAEFKTNSTTVGIVYQPPTDDTNLIRLIITNKKHRPAEKIDGFVFRNELDYTATNVLVESRHEPVLLGKSNGLWRIGFK